MSRMQGSRLLIDFSLLLGCWLEAVDHFRWSEEQSSHKGTQAIVEGSRRNLDPTKHHVSSMISSDFPPSATRRSASALSKLAHVC